MAGVDLAVALAATLLFRGLSFWLPMLPGYWCARRLVAREFEPVTAHRRLPPERLRAGPTAASVAASIGATVDRLSQRLTPRGLAALSFLSGVVLLVSGATPSAPGRLDSLRVAIPLGLIEVSHFLGSIIGVILLLLSQALWRRINAAYALTVAAMLAGIVASLLKGADYGEAAILAVVLLVIWRAQPVFDRRAALFATRFSPAWIAAIGGATTASIWLTVFAFEHVEYSNQLWWRFELHGDAPRALRAGVGAAITLLAFAVARLIRQARYEVAVPSLPDLDVAARIVADQPLTAANLVFLRDKSLLFNADHTAFVMYGVQGRTWLALADPIGPADQMASLIRDFVERCADFGGVPAFYEVSADHLHLYVDLGLAVIKLGEEARVDLTRFSLAGSGGRPYRQALHHLEGAHATIRVVATGEVPELMPQLRRISDEWLERQAGAEKGFSLGFFEPSYIARFPVAVVEQSGRVVAFANLWQGAQRIELSIDLMRFGHEAPRDVMESLLIHLMGWGKDQGFRWFSLGMAPLAGFETSPVAPLWNRVGAFVYQHGEAVYNFHGLRAYKEKFDPVWSPRYLAYPRGLHLPHILADASALVAGGYWRILRG